MTEKELREKIAAAVGDVDLADTDIPAIDLYLDQILSLLSDKNATASPRYRGRTLTKTMINNYSKDGVITPIAGKKYSRAHIVEMLLVYALKSTLSIEEIKRVLVGLREGCGFTGEDEIRAYHRFLSIKESNRARTGEVVADLIEKDQLNIQNDYDFFLALLNILSLSAYLKAVGQEMLESRYEDLEAVERERREKEKAEKRERDEREAQEKRERGEREAQEKAERKKEKAERKKEKTERTAMEGEAAAEVNAADEAPSEAND